MRKKLVALALIGAMTLALLTGCGKAQGGSNASGEVAGEQDSTGEKYDEKISFTLTGINTMVGEDYDDEFMQMLEEKFNVDITVLNNEFDGSNERFTTAVIGGNLADNNLWLDFSFNAYYEYVDQGLFAPLPEDWETQWPNLAHMVELSGYKDLLEVDGRTYGYTHAKVGNMSEFSNSELPCVYFRTDWAAQVGMPDMGADGTITLDELKEYVEKCEDAGLASKPAIGGESNCIRWLFASTHGVPYSDYAVVDGEYIWAPTHENYATMLETMQTWVADGLIDADFYSKTGTEYHDEFTSGQRSVWVGNGDGGTATTTLRYVMERCAVEEKVVGLAMVEDADGNVWGYKVPNYWLGSVFAPDIEEETMARILDIVDWACTQEGQISVMKGVYGLDWDYNEDGTINILDPAGYGSWVVFFMLGYCGEDVEYSPLNTSLDPDMMKIVKALYDMRVEDTYYEVPQAYEIYVGDLKNTYTGTVNVANMVVQVACGKEDPAAALEKFIEDNRGLWEPLLDDVNKAAGN